MTYMFHMDVEIYGSELGITNVQFPISSCGIFLIFPKYPSGTLNHIHIWEVTPRQSWGDTCRIFTCHLIGNQCIVDYKTWNGKMMREIGLITPTPTVNNISYQHDYRNKSAKHHKTLEEIDPNHSTETTLNDGGDSWWRHQMGTFSVLLVFVRGIHRSPVNSPHKGQWRGALRY